MQLHDGMTQMDQDLLDALQEAQASRTGRHVWVADGNLCPQSRSGRESRVRTGHVDCHNWLRREGRKTPKRSAIASLR